MSAPGSPARASVQAIREIADRLDGKPKQEAEVTLRNAVASELGDDDSAAIAASAKDEETGSDPKSDPSKLFREAIGWHQASPFRFQPAASAVKRCGGHW
jgi:ribosomal protein L22